METALLTDNVHAVV